MNETGLLLFFKNAFNLSAVTTNEYDDFYMSEGWKIDQPEPLSDAGLATDVLAAKNEATKTGNFKLANTLDFIFKYGDKALSMLTKNGILKNQNLVSAGYNTGVSTTVDKTTDTTNNAPDTKSRVFNVDFTDPKVLIICFLLLTIGGYFLLKPTAKQARR